MKSTAVGGFVPFYVSSSFLTTAFLWMSVLLLPTLTATVDTSEDLYASEFAKDAADTLQAWQEERDERVTRLSESDAVARSPVTVKMCPRSQWDPDQHRYTAARVVATMAVRVCTNYDAETDTCNESYDSWSTAVSRNDYLPQMVRQYSEIVLERYGGDTPHMWELYHTVDNLTYTEQCLTERYFWPVPEYPSTAHNFDMKLIKMAQVWAMTHPHKHLVLRWDYGRLWVVPEQHWNAGERALHTAYGLTSVTQSDSYYDATDLRPLYYYTLEETASRSTTKHREVKD